jgi:hypothetical protein
MGTAGLLATNLDRHMLEQRGTVIVPGITPDASVPPKTGGEVFSELGGRFLLRYLLPGQGDTAEKLNQLQGRTQWVTPTPYSPEETIAMLALPAPEQPRGYVLILDPRKISEVKGPRRILLGHGIEYILPQGFPKEALVLPWPVEVA